MLSDEPPTANGTVRMLSQNRGLKLTILETRPLDHYRRSHVRYLDHALTIGRRLPCDLIIQDENVSGRHLTLTRETDGLYISDNQSTNGTRLNGEVLKTTHPLRSDDIVIIGLTTLKISFEE